MATSQQLTRPAPPLGHYDVDISRSAVRAEIDTASFRTGNPLRDRRVRSAGFLDLSLQVRCVQNSWGGGIAHV